MAKKVTAIKSNDKIASENWKIYWKYFWHLEEMYNTWFMFVYVRKIYIQKSWSSQKIIVCLSEYNIQANRRFQLNAFPFSLDDHIDVLNFCS